jgi:hypothetical protein
MTVEPEAVNPYTVLGLLLEGIAELAADEAHPHREWLRYTDDVSLPEGSDPYAELAFCAGYATALGHAGTLVERLRSSVGEDR